MTGAIELEPTYGAAGALDGQALARGVSRHLRTLGFATLTEFTLTSRLRVDVIALGPRSEVWIVEVKSSRADFATDRKWQGYLPWCDRFFWGVSAAFPAEILPADAGLMRADPFDAAIVRMPPETTLAGARRRALVTRFARTAADRLAHFDGAERFRRFGAP